MNEEEKTFVGISTFPKDEKEQKEIEEVHRNMCEIFGFENLKLNCKKCGVLVLLGGQKGKDYSDYICKKCQGLNSDLQLISSFGLHKLYLHLTYNISGSSSVILSILRL